MWFQSKRKERSRACHGLVDSGSRVLLLLGSNLPAMVFVADCVMDTEYSANMEIPNYNVGNPLFTIEKGRYIEHTWADKKRLLKPTRPELLTDALREKSDLCYAKYRATCWLIRRINALRARIDTGLILQEYVYIGKQLQAQRYADSGFDDKLLPELSYVVQYAREQGISTQKAAELFLFRAQLDHDYLSKIEIVRSKFFDGLRAAKTAEETEEVMRSTRLEMNLA